MAKFIVTIWETREYIVPVEAEDEDAAKEAAEDDYVALSTSDMFVSTEVREVEKSHD